MSEQIDEIYSLMVPLVEQRLLIPRSNVMEVSGLMTLNPYNGSVPWLLGSMEWEDAMIPIVSFEGVCGDDVPSVAGRSRIVLFRCLTTALDTRAFGVVSQGFPQLIKVSEDALELDAESFGDSVPILCRVKMANQQPLIPDLEMLEQLVADAIAVST